MASTTLYPVSDGLTTNWTDQSAGTTNLYQAIDEGTASPNDADYVITTTPNTQLTFLLTDMPVDFISATSVTIKARMKCATSKSNVDISEIQIVESDNTTGLTNTDSVDTDIIIQTFTYTPAVTGTNTKTTWDGARLRFKTGPGTDGDVQVYATQVDLVYSNVHTGSGGVACGGTALVGKVDGNTASGGVLISGTSTTQRFLGVTALGGVVIAGSAHIVNIETASGGIVCGGDYVNTFSVTALGGALLAGNLESDNSFEETGSGGLLCSGFAGRNYVYNIVAENGIIVGGTIESISTGGATMSGFAGRNTIYNVVGDGGALLGGDSPLPEIGDGGALLGGDEIDNIFANEVTDVSGLNLLAGGTSPFTIIYTLDVSGGCIVGGLVTLVNHYQHVGSAGCVVGGTAPVGICMHVPSATEGVLINGTFGNVLIIKSITITGGVLLSGTNVALMTNVGLGGARLGGTATVTSVYKHTGSVGDEGGLVGGNINVNVERVLYFVTGAAGVQGILLGGDQINEIVTLGQGGAVIAGTSQVEYTSNVQAIGGVKIGLNTLLFGIELSTQYFVITTRETNTNNLSVAVGGEAPFEYTILRDKHAEECVKSLPCTTVPVRTKPRIKRVPAFSSCSKKIVLKGGFVSSATTCVMADKVQELISDNQDKIISPTQRETQVFVEVN